MRPDKRYHLFIGVCPFSKQFPDPFGKTMNFFFALSMIFVVVRSVVPAAQHAALMKLYSDLGEI